ncbi:hypothetical protein IMG5_108830 [Ichthyophthirius multifiliis]|uniref:CTP synthase n=1 Tax=Ichthyophthirius multifiliis TaxID=5932 RepID=G0QTI5_ICHMU|nr:hypothetical protein IMG5_108830 [Ichthyophthirius multifiliis]EGR31470.1 hypothetical protein IMG5_108830 [Ichthyophthirius multifiliis]|eukprot:XP_004034956.1 hypothetical protein IMG5_108830 [Ichthyophthirius multifiliis]
MVMQKQQKFIVVCGGVASGIGKGITIASLAALLKHTGFGVSLIKIDPYLNKDAGLMSPFEHGEVYILDDGGEVDLDLGNYERFLGINFTSKHNITSGKIYSSVIEKERQGYYKGSIVKFLPHATEEIKKQILEASQIPIDSSEKPPEIVLLELGGTVGDLESIFFQESIRQLQLDYGKENICIILVSYALKIDNSGYKTAPINNSIKALNFAGLNPDLVILRSQEQIDDEFKQTIAKDANIQSYQVINVPNLQFQFEVSLKLNEQLTIPIILQRLQLPIVKTSIYYFQKMTKYCREIIFTEKTKTKLIKIGFVGKYVEYQTDPYYSVTKAFEAASFEVSCRYQILWINPKILEQQLPEDASQNDKDIHKMHWEQLKQADGIFIAGGYGYMGFQGKILAAQYARENNIPCYGVCFGFQAMAVEFARNVIGILDAQTEEFKNDYASENFVIKLLPDTSLNKLGGTMRLGKKKTNIYDHNSLAYKIYGSNEIQERHRHRYEFNEQYIKQYEEKGYIFPGFQDSTPRRYSVIKYIQINIQIHINIYIYINIYIVF